MISALSVSLLLSAAGLASAACSATINSLSDVASAVKCTSITLNGFTVPAGQALTLSLATGTTLTMNGDILFGNKSWDGPLFTVSGTSVTFNGNGHKFDGGGPFYWDGQGLNGGGTKPDPMMKIKISGIFENVKVVNSPARAFSIGNDDPLTISNVVVDNSQGDQPNSKSGSSAAGHNTDGFDVSASNVRIQNRQVQVHNQDDCLAINKGTNITFTGNTCTGGHGISIGSIKSDVTVSQVTISSNTITNSDQALRIKTDASSSGSTVTGVTYSGNTGSGLRQFGILIDQSYPDTLGTPGTGVVVSNVNFVSPTTTLSVNSGAQQAAVNCGSGSCTGSWNWSNLKTSGGKAGKLTNCPVSGYNVDAAVKCTSVILNSFTVPAGQGLTLSLQTGTTVTMNGDISFGNLSWAGPLFTVSGKSITFNGNGHKFDGGGPFYWDGLGGNGGVEKPAPMMKEAESRYRAFMQSVARNPAFLSLLKSFFKNVTVVNSPARVYSISNPAALLITDLIIDNSQGDVPNAQSNGLPAGHNTDGFDCSTTNLIIQNRSVCNLNFDKTLITRDVLIKDDCLAINKGSNITFQNNTCVNGHGISVGSIASNVVVSDIMISGNTIISNDQALRIKADATSTNSTVADVTYSGNIGIGLRQFGVLIDQSYPDTLKTPGNGVIISGINFVPPLNNLTVISGAMRAAVNCGKGSCIGPWDWADLEVSGGSPGPINNFTGIENFRQ
ncbi:hypothetical protein CVT26_000102 [Gymnopilus dilepis]|uniref:endo-polygalacturonase n=1 Tax=Gymnopilus dilepis TaxID=231916 RepID=A0A409VGT4_9AGAR|nr:hypothetical protein CVT26_000102 [Gymnopilus dilepis]